MIKGPATIHFNLQGEYIELNKLLKASRLCITGGAANLAVVQGYVKVDGKLETRKTAKIRVGQKIEFNGRVVSVEKESP